MFRSSLKGFKKSDVNNYIINMHREFADTQEEYELELTHLRKCLCTAEEQLCAANTELTSAKSELGEKEALLSKLSAKLCDAELRLESCRQTEKENAALKNRLQKLEDNLSEYKNELESTLLEVSELEKQLSEKAAECAQMYEDGNVLFSVNDVDEEGKAQPKNDCFDTKGKHHNIFLSKLKGIFR